VERRVMDTDTEATTTTTTMIQDFLERKEDMEAMVERRDTAILATTTTMTMDASF